MKFRLCSIFLLLLCNWIFAAEAFAIQLSKRSQKSPLPTILKADQIEGDKVANVLIASGNVEISKGTSIIYADQVIYDKSGGVLRAIGSVKIKDLEVGNVLATKAEVKDDFSKGKFYETRLIFLDGSYLSSSEIDHRSPLITVLQNPIYSICPNSEIVADNNIAGEKPDFASIKSKETTIDRGTQRLKSKGNIFRINDVPLFYLPYVKVPLQSKKRESGFLHPNYMKTTNLGLGVKIPYYFNIAPNMDLTTTPYIALDSSQFLILNNFRHIVSYGDYNLDFELANNKINSNEDSTVVKRTNKDYRWDLFGKGRFDFTKNSGFDFNLNTVGDRNYLRDYHFNYVGYTVSKANFDYIDKRDYHAVKTINIQELEDASAENSAPLILPQIDSHIESKPFFFKEKLALTSNVVVINREDGLEYRRLSAIPEANIPFNFNGNLFVLDGKVQGDFYSLEENYKYTQKPQDYQSVQTNYKPELSLSWRLPLIRKGKGSTLMIEPMANFVTSSYRKNFDKLPNEDSNNSELTATNLFVTDRISGFDRNEAGTRVNYGVKSSLFNQYGEFGLTLGQGYRKDNSGQDVVISGFAENNKSNVVGQLLYKAVKYLTLVYSFQLNQSNYRNDVNQLTTTLNFDCFSLGADYLLMRQTDLNSQKREQINLSSSIRLTPRWKVTLIDNLDIVEDRTLARGIAFYRDGCCTTFGFSVMETNPSSLTKPQKAFNLSFAFKNL